MALKQVVDTTKSTYLTKRFEDDEGNRYEDIAAKSLVGWYRFKSSGPTNLSTNKFYDDDDPPGLIDVSPAYESSASTPTLSKEKFGEVLYDVATFDGVDDLVTIGTATKWDHIIGNQTAATGKDGGSTQKMTFAAWIHPTGNGDSAYPRIIDIGGEAAVYMVKATSGGDYSNRDKIGFFIRWSGGLADWRIPNPVSNLDNNWHHVVVTYDPSSINNKPKFYINGKLVTDNPDVINAASGTYDGVNNDSNKACIGNQGPGGTFAGDRSFQGKMSEVCIWNQCLTSENIKAMYNVSQSRFTRNQTISGFLNHSPRIQSIENSNYHDVHGKFDDTKTIDFIEPRQEATIRFNRVPSDGLPSGHTISITDAGSSIKKVFEFQRGVILTFDETDATNVVNAGGFIVGKKYKIVSTGSSSTDFTLIGSSNNTVGTVFTATGPGTGTGTARPENVEVNIRGIRTPSGAASRFAEAVNRETNNGSWTFQAEKTKQNEVVIRRGKIDSAAACTISTTAPERFIEVIGGFKVKPQPATVYPSLEIKGSHLDQRKNYGGSIRSDIELIRPVYRGEFLRPKVMHEPSPFDESLAHNAFGFHEGVEGVSPERDLASNFYVSGSSIVTSPASIKSRKRVVIDMPVASDTTLEFKATSASGNHPMAYYNTGLQRWELIGMGTGSFNAAQSLAANLSTRLQSFKEAMDHTMVGFSPSRGIDAWRVADRSGASPDESQGFEAGGNFRLVPTGSLAFQNGNTQFPRVLSVGSLASPTNTFGFPMHPKFHATGSQEIVMSNYIKRPFVLEKIVYEFNVGSPDTVTPGVMTDASAESQTVDLDTVTFFLLNQRSAALGNELNETPKIRIGDSDSNTVRDDLVEVTNITNGVGSLPRKIQLTPDLAVQAADTMIKGRPYRIVNEAQTDNWRAELAGSATNAGSFVIGKDYRIEAVGTSPATDFTLIGAKNNTVGTVFKATGVGAGNGNAKEIIEGLGIPFGGPEGAPDVVFTYSGVAPIKSSGNFGTVEELVQETEVDTMRDLVTWSRLTSSPSNFGENILDSRAKDVRKESSLVVNPSAENRAFGAADGSPVKYSVSENCIAAVVQIASSSIQTGAPALGKIGNSKNYFGIATDGSVEGADAALPASQHIMFARPDTGRTLAGIESGRSLFAENPAPKRMYTFRGAKLPDLKITAYESDNSASPYVLLPTDKLILGCQAPISADITGGTHSQIKLGQGEGRIILYGYEIQKETELIRDFNESSTGNSSFFSENIGTLAVRDQFETNPRMTYYRSSIDEVVTGSMQAEFTRGNSPQGQNVDNFTTSIQKKARQVIGRNSQGTQGERGSLLRARKLQDTSERYYDSMLPDIQLLARADNVRAVDITGLNTSGILLGVSGSSEAYRSYATTIPANPGFKLIWDNWFASYPFEARYQPSTTTRLAGTKKNIIMPTQTGAGKATTTRSTVDHISIAMFEGLGDLRVVGNVEGTYTSTGILDNPNETENTNRLVPGGRSSGIFINSPKINESEVFLAWSAESTVGSGSIELSSDVDSLIKLKALNGKTLTVPAYANLAASTVTESFIFSVQDKATEASYATGKTRASVTPGKIRISYDDSRAISEFNNMLIQLPFTGSAEASSGFRLFLDSAGTNTTGDASTAASGLTRVNAGSVSALGTSTTTLNDMWVTGSVTQIGSVANAINIVDPADGSAISGQVVSAGSPMIFFNDTGHNESQRFIHFDRLINSFDAGDVTFPATQDDADNFDLISTITQEVSLKFKHVRGVNTNVHTTFTDMPDSGEDIVISISSGDKASVRILGTGNGNLTTDLVEKDAIEITSTDGTTAKYVVVNGNSSSVSTGDVIRVGSDTGAGTADSSLDGAIAVSVNLTSSVSSNFVFLTALKSAITSAGSPHNGKITAKIVDSSGAEQASQQGYPQYLLLTQAVAGLSGNTTITHNLTGHSLTDTSNATVAGFTGGLCLGTERAVWGQKIHHATPGDPGGSSTLGISRSEGFITNEFKIGHSLKIKVNNFGRDRSHRATNKIIDYNDSGATAKDVIRFQIARDDGQGAGGRINKRYQFFPTNSNSSASVINSKGTTGASNNIRELITTDGIFVSNYVFSIGHNSSTDGTAATSDSGVDDLARARLLAEAITNAGRWDTTTDNVTDQASAEIEYTANPASGTTLTLISTSGTSKTYEFAGSLETVAEGNIKVIRGGNARTTFNNLESEIDDATGHNAGSADSVLVISHTLGSNTSEGTFKITQRVSGTAGNTAITNTLGAAATVPSEFTGGLPPSVGPYMPFIAFASQEGSGASTDTFINIYFTSYAQKDAAVPTPVLTQVQSGASSNTNQSRSGGSQIANNDILIGAGAADPFFVTIGQSSANFIDPYAFVDLEITGDLDPNRQFLKYDETEDDSAANQLASMVSVNTANKSSVDDIYAEIANAINVTASATSARPTHGIISAVHNPTANTLELTYNSPTKASYYSSVKNKILLPLPGARYDLLDFRPITANETHRIISISREQTHWDANLNTAFKEVVTQIKAGLDAALVANNATGDNITWAPTITYPPVADGLHKAGSFITGKRYLVASVDGDVADTDEFPGFSGTASPGSSTFKATGAGVGIGTASLLGMIEFKQQGKGIIGNAAIASSASSSDLIITGFSGGESSIYGDGDTFTEPRDVEPDSYSSLEITCTAAATYGRFQDLSISIGGVSYTGRMSTSRTPANSNATIIGISGVGANSVQLASALKKSLETAFATQIQSQDIKVETKSADAPDNKVIIISAKNSFHIQGATPTPSDSGIEDGTFAATDWSGADLVKIVGAPLKRSTVQKGIEENDPEDVDTVYFASILAKDQAAIPPATDSDNNIFNLGSRIDSPTDFYTKVFFGTGNGPAKSPQFNLNEPSTLSVATVPTTTNFVTHTSAADSDPSTPNVASTIDADINSNASFVGVGTSTQIGQVGSAISTILTSDKFIDFSDASVRRMDITREVQSGETVYIRFAAATFDSAVSNNPTGTTSQGSSIECAESNDNGVKVQVSLDGGSSYTDVTSVFECKIDGTVTTDSELFRSNSSTRFVTNRFDTASKSRNEILDNTGSPMYDLGSPPTITVDQMVPLREYEIVDAKQTTNFTAMGAASDAAKVIFTYQLDTSTEPPSIISPITTDGGEPGTVKETNKYPVFQFTANSSCKIRLIQHTWSSQSVAFDHFLFRFLKFTFQPPIGTVSPISARGNFNQTAVAQAVEIRGAKYGLISPLKLNTSAIFRAGSFGQCRDMLEQRKFTRTFDGQRVSETAVAVSFQARNTKRVVSPEETNSSNLDSFCTSSLPYFDGLNVDRTSVQPDLVDEVDIDIQV